MADTKPATKKFGKGERSIPHHTQKASKYYPAVDVAVAKKVCLSLAPGSLRERET
jgi:large subunit ribosomal protein L6e